MTARTDSFTLISRRLRGDAPMPAAGETCSIAEAIRRIDMAIARRRAA